MNLFRSHLTGIKVHLPADLKKAQTIAIAAARLIATGELDNLSIVDPKGSTLAINGRESSAEIARLVRASLGGDAVKVDYCADITIEDAYAELQKAAEQLEQNLLVNFNGVIVPFDRFTEKEDLARRIIDEIQLRPLSNGFQLITASMKANRIQCSQLALGVANWLKVPVVFAFTNPNAKVAGQEAYWVAEPGSTPAKISLASRSLSREASVRLKE